MGYKEKSQVWLNQAGRKENMSLSDPIGDMIARVKNAQDRSHKKVELPSSNFKVKIADILKNEGFIKDFKVQTESNKSLLSLELKYHSGNPVISTFERVSKPGRRIFSSADSLPKINNGLGIAIVSTPKGVMTCLLYTSPSPRDGLLSRMPSSA